MLISNQNRDLYGLTNTIDMKYGKWLGLLGLIGFLANPVLAQNVYSSGGYPGVVAPHSFTLAGSKINYYKDNREVSTHVSAPEAFLKRVGANGRMAAPKAQFIVDYTNFTAEARTAFQYAVDIWSTLISSPVPIRIKANWIYDEPNLLGSAGPASYRYNVDGAQKNFAFYPIALAEKIARRQLNDPNDADIVADFNRNNDWYYGIDGKPLKNQTDLVTVVLHELGHALGFIGFFGLVGDNGVYMEAFPSVYDYFLETGQGKRLVTSTKDFPNNSVELKFQLAGYNLYLNGANLKQASAQQIKVWVPYEYTRASSIYHLDEREYPPGNINSLMTPKLALGESIHTPGPLVLQFMTDLEWKTTSVLHDPIKNTEEQKDLVFSTRVISDTTLMPGSVRFFYRKKAPTATDTTFSFVDLTQVGTTNEYRYTMPAAQANGDTWYYFQAQDLLGRSYTNPGKSVAGGQLWNHVFVGPDNLPPTIRYSPSKNAIFSTTVADSLPIYARISDDRSSVASASVEYQINGVSQPPIALRYNPLKINTIEVDSVYAGRIDFPANSLKVGDKITYRIIAQDAARAKNQAVSPASGFYELTVVAQKPVVEQYINTFDASSSAGDFAGYGFSIATPTGFSNPAIHSEHPYRNGSDLLLQTNYEYRLLSPIRIKANPDSATIRFDEIVLVEPGETGSKLGDANFYDYVLVEGSNDNGQTWKPLVDAYSSVDKKEWLTWYNLYLTGGAYNEWNSEAVGTPALYRQRLISLLKPQSAFKAGDQILVRFRLFADQLSYGWGWAIDNLRIQAPPPPVVLGVDPVSAVTFDVYPNPVNNGQLRLQADFSKSIAEVGLTIRNLTGQSLRQQTIKLGGQKLDKRLDVSDLPDGLYFVQLTAGGVVLTKKIIIANGE
ncbi:MAG: T9SS type A sorting domain-containing protein [Spirosoma sp.]|nr:T9SS type A sorting domain-containing protein [Spirosoma sp.]